MIDFSDIWMQNFMSFGERQHIRLKDQGIIRVEGRNLDEGDSNRAGKSAIIEALLWCLFGRTIRGLRHDQVVNRFSKKDCSVEVAFHVGDTAYRVKRYRKHGRHENRLRLWAGGEALTFRHEEDTQSRLEAIIGTGFGAFSNSVLFGGVRPFSSLPDSEQRKVLEAFLHFDQFDAAQKRTKVKISDAEEKLQELETELVGLTERTKSLRDKRRVLEKSEKVFIEKLEKDLADVRQELRELGPPVDSEDVDLGLQVFESHVDTRRAKLSEAEAQHRELKHKLKDIRRAIKRRSKLLGKPCPTCGRIISENTIGQYLEHLVAEKRGVKKKLHLLDEVIKSLERRYLHARKDLKRVQEKQSQRSAKEVEQRKLEEREKQAREHLRHARSFSTPLEEDLLQAYKEHSQALSKLLRTAHKITMVKSTLRDLKFWEEGFGNKGIKALVIKEALPVLNSKLKEYANAIFGSKAKLEFLPTKQTKTGAERELFHVSYLARKGADSYIGESSGGKRRIDVCVLLVFSWLSRTCNLILIDELLDGLDESGRETVLHILSAIRGTVLVISHNWQLKSDIGKLLVVTKENGYSRVEAA